MPTVSTEIEPIFRYVYSEVAVTAAELDIPFVVVGASARDIVMHHVHGAPIQRATNDIDFALQVPNWGSFVDLRQGLIRKGFGETDMQHRLTSPDNVRIDILPFGAIRDANALIEWPDDDGRNMNVLGFQETMDHSEVVRIQTDPVLDIPVATPVGMVLLKLISWTDRPQDRRVKDATDLQYFLSNYDRIPSVLEEIYADPQIGNQYEWDATLMGAHLLGKHSASIAGDETAQKIKSYIVEDSARQNRLVLEMCHHIDDQIERAQLLLDAFFRGFLETN